MALRVIDMLSFGPFTADYSRYLPAKTNGWRLFWANYAGNIVSTVASCAVGAPTGIMDQSASLLGERDAAVFLDCRSLGSEVVPLGLEEAGLQIVIIERFEGISNPEDETIVLALLCNTHGCRGTYVAPYGKDMPSTDATLIRKIPDGRKK